MVDILHPIVSANKIGDALGLKGRPFRRLVLVVELDKPLTCYAELVATKSGVEGVAQALEDARTDILLREVESVTVSQKVEVQTSGESPDQARAFLVDLRDVVHDGLSRDAFYAIDRWVARMLVAGRHEVVDRFLSMREAKELPEPLAIRVLAATKHAKDGLLSRREYFAGVLDRLREKGTEQEARLKLKGLE